MGAGRVSRAAEPARSSRGAAGALGLAAEGLRAVAPAAGAAPGPTAGGLMGGWWAVGVFWLDGVWVCLFFEAGLPKMFPFKATQANGINKRHTHLEGNLGLASFWTYLPSFLFWRVSCPTSENTGLG